MHPDDRDAAEQRVRNAIQNHVRLENEYRIVLASGEDRWINALGDTVYDAGGRPLRMSGFCVDITERKHRQERIIKLTRLYAVLSQVNEAIVRTARCGSLYSDVCRIVAEQGGFPLVWIGQVREKQVVPRAWWGPAADYVKEIRVEVQGELGSGPTGTCIRENRAVVNDDFAVNPAAAPWREPALRYGFRASAAFPLRRQGKADRRAHPLCLRSQRL